MNYRVAVSAAAVAVMMIVGGAGGAAAQSYTTATEDGKVRLELDFLAPQCYYEFDGTTLSWEEPHRENTHYVRLVLRDAGGEGTIGGCKVVAAISDHRGKVVSTSVTLHETWDRELPHYGDNIHLPDELTTGELAVKIEPPKGRRLGKDVGDFLNKTVIVSFGEVDFARVRAEEKPAEVTTGPVKVEWPRGRRPYVEPTPYPGAKSAP